MTTEERNAIFEILRTIGYRLSALENRNYRTIDEITFDEHMTNLAKIWDLY